MKPTIYPPVQGQPQHGVQSLATHPVLLDTHGPIDHTNATFGKKMPVAKNQWFWTGLLFSGLLYLAAPAASLAQQGQAHHAAGHAAPAAGHSGGHSAMHADSHHDHAHGGHHGAVSAKEAAQIAALPTSKNVFVESCWIRQLPSPAPSAGYFIVKNQGPQSVSLVAAGSPAYDAVMLHQTTHSDGMSRMSMVETVAISPGSLLEFKPGGFHAMLEQPLQDIKVGSSIDMVFQFDNNEKAEASCEVRPAGAMGKAH